MDASPAPAPTPARVAAAATAAGCARMANLRGALSAALRAALTSADFEVGGGQGGVRACVCDEKERGQTLGEGEGHAPHARARARARACALYPPFHSPPPQDFRACFPAFNEDVCVALHDLYRQVLHSTRAHAEVREREGERVERVSKTPPTHTHRLTLLFPHHSG